MIHARIRKQGNSYVVTIPREEMERLDLHEGDQVAIQATKLETRAVLPPELQKAFDESREPFVDGNERTAYAVAGSFLRVNGYLYDGGPIAFAKQLEAVDERTDSLDAATDRFEAWLRAITVPRSPQPDES
jgi:antitoxin component of MazEF toxin-antitoxin module